MVELYFRQRVGYRVSAHPYFSKKFVLKRGGGGGGVGAYKVLYSIKRGPLRTGYARLKRRVRDELRRKTPLGNTVQ